MGRWRDRESKAGWEEEEVAGVCVGCVYEGGGVFVAGVVAL